MFGHRGGWIWVGGAAVLLLIMGPRVLADYELTHPDPMGPVYGVDETARLMDELAGTGYVVQTTSGNADLVVGMTSGSDVGGYTHGNPAIPSLPLYGFNITDAAATGRKAKIVVIGGTHTREQAASHQMDAFLRRVVSDEPLMQALRRHAEIYVYPQINPEGRYAYNLAGNPYSVERDTPRTDGVDLNRIWNHSDSQLAANWPEIGLLQDIMRTDTGGNVDYFLDFHARSFTTPLLEIWLNSSMIDSPLAQAVMNRDGRYKQTRFDTNGGSMSSAEWAMSAAGLGATWAYTPEVGRDADPSLYVAAGQAWAEGLASVVVPEPASLTVVTLGGALALLRRSGSPSSAQP